MFQLPQSATRLHLGSWTLRWNPPALPPGDSSQQVSTLLSPPSHSPPSQDPQPGRVVGSAEWSSGPRSDGSQETHLWRGSAPLHVIFNTQSSKKAKNNRDWLDLIHSGTMLRDSVSWPSHWEDTTTRQSQPCWPPTTGTTPPSWRLAPATRASGWRLLWRSSRWR